MAEFYILVPRAPPRVFPEPAVLREWVEIAGGAAMIITADILFWWAVAEAFIGLGRLVRLAIS